MFMEEKSSRYPIGQNESNGCSYVGFSIRKILKRYHRDELGREAFKKLSDRKHALPIQQMAWRAAIRVFSFGMARRWYMALAVGIRFLIESKIDERFSDTGIKEEQ